MPEDFIVESESGLRRIIRDLQRERDYLAREVGRLKAIIAAAQRPAAEIAEKMRRFNNG